MKTTSYLKIVASTLMLGGTLITATGASTPEASQSPVTAAQRRVAAEAAAAARLAMAAKDYGSAIVQAERAVQYSPRDPSMRMLLGISYLNAGRFAAAETAFSDVLTLSPDDGRAALDLALVQVANGKGDAAKATLGDYRDRIGASDYGLAMALAGDNAEAVRVLEAAVRLPNADAKARQNLALAYAMGGEWEKARAMAANDLSPADTDTRMAEWASFAHPGAGSQQVASLLGIHPASEDSGEPTRLALNNAVAAPVATAEAVPAPVAPAVEAPAPVFETALASPAAAPVAEAPPEAVAVTGTNVVFGPHQEVVQVIHEEAPAVAAVAPVRARGRVPVKVVVRNIGRHAPLIRAAAAPVKQEVATAETTAAPPAEAAPSPAHGFKGGKFVVQIGAYESIAASRAQWKQAAVRYDLASFTPGNASVKVAGVNYVRLTIGGFTSRADAAALCAKIHEKGGNCFVRGLLTDHPAQWVNQGTPTPRANPAKSAKAKPAKPQQHAAAAPARVASR